jgi:hypothetical protein
MKKGTNIILILLIAVCVAALFGYRMLHSLRTDSQPPEIKLEETIPELSVYDSREALLLGITALDKRDGDVSDLVVVERVSLLNADGQIMVSYAAFDRSGNVAKAVREVQFTDYTRPKFTLNAPLLYVHGTGFDVLRELGVQDVVDGDLKHRIKATSLDGEPISTQGTHTVQVQVTNSLGDTVKLRLPVEVYASGTYNAKLTLTDYLVYLPQGGTFDAAGYLKEFTAGKDSIALQGGNMNNFAAKISGLPDMQTPGVYAVDYRISRQEETTSAIRQEYVAYSRLIVIVEG